MKNLNLYISEKLIINKDSENELPTDVKLVLSWYKNQDKKALKIIENWFIDNNVEHFICLMNKSYKEKFNNHTSYDINKFKENMFVFVDYNDIYNYCDQYFKGDIGSWSDKYGKYITPEEIRNKTKTWIDIWSVKNAILLTTYWFEILIIKKEE